MKDCYVTFRSVTAAQRGESLLRRGGLDIILQRTPRWMEEQGCGYSLRMRHTDAAQAIGLLKHAGVSYRKLYIQKENGMFEEWKL